MPSLMRKRSFATARTQETEYPMLLSLVRKEEIMLREDAHIMPCCTDHSRTTCRPFQSHSHADLSSIWLPAVYNVPQ